MTAKEDKGDIVLFVHLVMGTLKNTCTLVTRQEYWSVDIYIMKHVKKATDFREVQLKNV